MTTLTAREASIFACWCDTVVAPGNGLPPVASTDAVRFFDFWLERSPRLNRAGLRALLYGIELAPRLLGFKRRLRALPESERVRALHALEQAKAPQLRPLTKLLKGGAFLIYYGDDGIMRSLGYDADERVRTGRALHTSAELPLDGTRPSWELEVVQLDPNDGAWLLDRAPLLKPQKFDRQDEWEARIQQARSSFGGDQQ